MSLAMNIVTYPIGFIIATYGGCLIMKQVLGSYKKPAEELGGFESAGRIIGLFERAIVVILVFNNAYSALGLIISAKSITQVYRLKNSETAEYFLIGTLSSVAFAIMVGEITKYVSKLTKMLL